jgi:copper transport protein
VIILISQSLASTPLDDFLAGAGSETDTGELLQRIGLIGSLIGITLVLGLIVFLAVVHAGRRSEIRLLLRVAAAAGLLTMIGAGIEIAGSASVLDIAWSDALSESSAAMLRLLAGLLIALGLIDHIMPAGDGSDMTGDAIDETDAQVRWMSSAASAFGIGGAVVGALSFGFDGHTVTEGPRLVHAAVNMVHVSAGGVWFGGVVALAILSVRRRRVAESTALLIVRFSSVATVALIAVTLAGVLMSLMIIDGLGDYTGTDWGQMLLLKTAGVAVAVAIGAYNHFVVVPALERDPDDAAVLGRSRTTVLIEAVILLFVVVVTVFLSVASTN